jgi:DNA mismatch endonuclease Vsr
MQTCMLARPSNSNGSAAGATLAWPRLAVHDIAMPPRPDFTDIPVARRRNMAAIKPKDTKPELAVRRLLHAAGYRYRLHRRDLPGCPDIVFPGRRCVIDVRGCFWHRHTCANAVLPKSRAEWWAEKLASNVARDQSNRAALEAAGWRVMIIWECEVRCDIAGISLDISHFLGPSRVPLRD